MCRVCGQGMVAGMRNSIRFPWKERAMEIGKWEWFIRMVLIGVLKMDHGAIQTDF